MLPLGPPDIKFSVETQKSPFGDIGNLTKLTHDPLPPYHRVLKFKVPPTELTRIFKILKTNCLQSLLELVIF